MEMNQELKIQIEEGIEVGMKPEEIIKEVVYGLSLIETLKVLESKGQKSDEFILALTEFFTVASKELEAKLKGEYCNG